MGSRFGPQDLRASDVDRELVVTLLTEAAADGRLTLAEHEERSERALSARTLGELTRLTADLTPPSGQPIKLYPQRMVMAAFARERREGRWVVPEKLPVTAFFGNVVLDLRDAVFQSPRATIHATAIAGQIRLIVPPSVAVSMDGRSVLGLRSVRDRGAAGGTGPSGTVALDVRTRTLGGAVKAVTARRPRRRGGLLRRS